jgi:hypothetical protein
MAHTVIPALGKLRQEDYEFEASLVYIVKLCLKKKKKKEKEKERKKMKKRYL